MTFVSTRLGRFFGRTLLTSPLHHDDRQVGADAFAVIRDAMKDKDRVALAKIVIAHREHILALEPLGNKGLLGTTLRYDYEVRDKKNYFSGVPSLKVSKNWISSPALPPDLTV
jgi:DNA end-binding protein Ku